MNKYSKCIDCIHAINEDCLGLRECLFNVEELDYVEEEHDNDIEYSYNEEDRF